MWRSPALVYPYNSLRFRVGEMHCKASYVSICPCRGQCRFLFISLLFVLRCFSVLDFECFVNIHTIWVKQLSAEPAAGLTSFGDYLLWYLDFIEFVSFLFLFITVSLTGQLHLFSHQYREMYSTFFQLICTIYVLIYPFYCMKLHRILAVLPTFAQRHLDKIHDVYICSLHIKIFF